jgi:hypothetical protein
LQKPAPSADCDGCAARSDGFLAVDREDIVGKPPLPRRNVPQMVLAIMGARL